MQKMLNSNEMVEHEKGWQLCVAIQQAIPFAKHILNHCRNCLHPSANKYTEQT